MCEEMIFPLPMGKNDRTLGQHFFPRAVEISFLHIKGCGNAIPVRNEEISPCNFTINPLKNHRILKKKIFE